MSNYRLRSGSGVQQYNGSSVQEDLDDGGGGGGGVLNHLGQQTNTFHSSQNGLNSNTLSRQYGGGGTAVHASNANLQQQQQLQAAYSATELHRYAQNADRYTTTTRTGHWAGSTANFHAAANGGVGGGGVANPDMGQYSDERGSSNRGSQAALLSVPSQRHKWAKGKDFLFTTWAFVIGAHSLWEFPVLTLKYGGVVFILVYLTMFLILGSPMLLLEMALGQYGGLAPTKLFRNLCPGLTGVGFAMCASCIIVCLTNFAVITWSCQALYLLFSEQSLSETFFNKRVLDVGSASLGQLGLLHGQLALSLGIACIVVFIFIAAGTKSLGKVSMLLVPLCYGLLMTLTIRGCMGKGGPEGILALLAPDWSHITKPWVWLEASKFVFLSLQLGMGVVATYSSYNKYHHNIIRDAGIVVIGHFVWSILSVLFVFSLLGLADFENKISIRQLTQAAAAASDSSTVAEGLIAKDFWLVGITLAETALGGLEYNWLWSGLLFCLVVLTALATVMGALETVGACVVDEYPSMRQYKPAIVFTLMSAVFMVDLVMATRGGIHVYYLLTSYTAWPLLFFGLLTVVGAAYSHGGKYLMKDIGDMSKMPLTHYISAHLSVLYASIIPILMAVSLGWCLYGVSRVHTDMPLANFAMQLPPQWGMALGWSLTFIPILCTAAGLLYHLIWKSRGIPFKMHLKRSFKPTDTWYENEHRELMQLDPTATKDSPVLAFRQRAGKASHANGNITEV